MSLVMVGQAINNFIKNKHCVSVVCCEVICSQGLLEQLPLAVAIF